MTVQPGKFSSKKAGSTARVYGNFERPGHPQDCSISLQGIDTLVLGMSHEFVTATWSALVPNQWLLLRNDAVYAAGWLSLASSGATVVNPPTVIPVPVGDVLAASILPLCLSYELDFSLVAGSAGRNWEEVDIKISTPGSYIDLSTVEEHIVNQTGYLKKGLTSITLDIDPGTYLFNITFQNFLGGTSFWSLSVTKYSTNEMPYIILQSDSGTSNLDNSKQVTLYASSCK